MGRKIRWLVIGGMVVLFVVLAFLRKETPQLDEARPNVVQSQIDQATIPAPTMNQVVPPPNSPQEEATHMPVVEITAVIHTVQPGETLFKIAQQHDVSIEEVAQLNQILDPSQIVAGQTIQIPTDSTTKAILTNATDTISPTNTPPPPFTQSANTLNNIPLTAIINLPPETRQHIDEIYTRGQEIGRNPNAFSKLGDSTIMAPGLLVQFDQGAYNLGEFSYLQVIIDQYIGSFERYGAATHVGLHAWTVFDPMIADNSWCLGSETVLACELRLHNPSIIFIRLGSNDAGIPDSFDQHTREVVQATIANGVIPIIGTKADRFEGADNINNQILRQIATDYNVPLWDFDILAATLPNRGLSPEDNVHIDKATVTNDYTQPTAFQSGQAMQDLSALLMLDAIWQEINN